MEIYLPSDRLGIMPDIPGMHEFIGLFRAESGSICFLLVGIWYYCVWFAQFYKKFESPGGSKSFLAVSFWVKSPSGVPYF